jgi:predicted metal-binding protein
MTTITVCTTCRVPETREDKTRTPDGEGFLPRVAEAGQKAGVTVRGTACLMGCEHGCNLAISGNGKLTYVLGRFDGTTEDAQAVAEYAAKHQQSESGAVPYREWPQGVKGHFIARVPPL